MDDDSEKDGSQRETVVRPGKKLIQKVGHKMKKTQTNVRNAAKQTQANLISTAKQTHANIRTVSERTTSAVENVVEKTTGVHLLSRKGSKVTDSVTSTTSRDSTNRTELQASRALEEQGGSLDDNVKLQEIHSQDVTKEEPATQKSKQAVSFSLKESFSGQDLLQPAQVLHNPSLLALLLAILLSAYNSLTNHSLIIGNQAVPLHVALTWAALALVVGVEIGRQQAAQEFREFMSLQAAIAEQQKLASAPTTITTTRQVSTDEPQQVTSTLQRMMNQVQQFTTTPWTTLGKDPRRKRQRWERSGTVLVSNYLTRALQDKTPPERRKSLACIGVSQTDIQVALEEDESLFVGTGVEDPERMRAKTLEEEAIEPLCRLRGMDIFLTDNPESDLADHSFLIQNGLRDRPTLIINVLTQWGNVALYFELPEWITSWDKFFTEGEDPEDVLALKRFLNGNDEYRNQRFKCLPVLVDGPAAIKYVAPSTRNTATIATPTLPITWKKHPPTYDDSGQTILHPCLEVECDLMANRTKRSMASLVKRYLKNMVGDVAILIEKPYLQQEEEPRACLGMCRFDRIDVQTCPAMPPREVGGDTEEEQEIRRASIALGQPLDMQHTRSKLRSTL